MSSPDRPLDRIGGYDVLAPIAEGGMAVVYVGRAADGPPVSIKVIRPEYYRNPEFVAMFLDESRIAANLSHPNIVELLEVGRDGDRPFLVMELLRGRTLRALWDACKARGMRLPFDVTAWIGARVADALHYAHELRDEKGAPREVVHRDVNPSNIFVTTHGVPKLIDFGLARAKDRIASTGAGVLKGKLAYVSPEQVAGQPADRRADIFALGVTLWELTVDRRLFKGESDVETLRRVLAAEAPDPRTLVPGFPPRLGAAIVRALARDPALRFPSAAELARELDACAGVGAEMPATLARILANVTSDVEAWEKAADAALRRAPSSASAGTSAEELIEVWDNDAEKMTWMQSVRDTSAPPLPPLATRDGTRAPTREELVSRIEARLASLVGAGDPVGVARAHLELALIDEVLGDAAHAAIEATSALAADPATPLAHAIARRARHSRSDPRAGLAHLDAELETIAGEAARADLLGERARILAASGADVVEVRAAWERVLAVVPDHAAALRGLDATFRGVEADAETHEQHAAHLARLADAYAAEPRLAAWTLVERARVLDLGLGDADAAWGALVRALSLDAGAGPVRDACVRHAVTHRDAAALVTLLVDEAAMEADGARAARLELDAALLARHRLADAARAVTILQNAAARAPTSPLVDRRVLDELVALHEDGERWPEARAARRARLDLVFVEDARARAHELRRLASHAERAGDLPGALAAVVDARAAAPGDLALIELEDRLLAQAGNGPGREALWMREGARETEPGARARALVRAASVAEEGGRRDAAIVHLRAALAAAPADVEALDHLARLLIAPPAAPAASEVRARVALYTRAAATETDVARRIAYLERAALLWEEAMGEAELASAVFEEILAIEPHRRSALLGLARTAARAGRADKLARALLDEASVTPDAHARAALEVRAATALAPADEERARVLVEGVLERDPAHVDARALEIRLHATAGRWERVDRALAARIEHAAEAPARVAALLERAELLATRLGRPREAVDAYRAARALDPTHPVPPEAIVALVAAEGDPRALRDVLRDLVAGATSPLERASFHARIGEIDELVLLDDDGATKAYAAALADAPGEASIAERLARVHYRCASGKEPPPFELLVETRSIGGPPGPRRELELALAAIDFGGGAARAITHLDAALASEPGHLPALRVLESLARASDDTAALVRALAGQLAALTTPSAQLGVAWALADVGEWRRPSAPADALADYLRIHALAPTDRAALDAIVRHALAASRAPEPEARVTSALSSALTELGAQASDDTTRLGLDLAVVLVFIAHGGPAGTRVALVRAREALRADAASITAALATVWLARAAGDAEATVAGVEATAALEPDGRVRAHLFVQASALLVRTDDTRLGDAPARRMRAGELLERALEADPESVAAASSLIALRAQDGARDRLMASLRAALDRAKSTDAVMLLGWELSRAARAEKADAPTALHALERVRAVAPAHVPSLEALAALYIGESAWGQAVAALEAIVAAAREPKPRYAALLELAGIYERVLARPADAERALRTALEIVPDDSRALGWLVEMLRAREREGERDTRRETAELLGRLARAERGAERKSMVFMELTAVQESLGDRAAAEHALIEAIAEDPRPSMRAQLASFHAASPVNHARALAAVVARTEELGRPDPASLAALGELEIDALGKVNEGVAHLRAALALAPADGETRALLARSLARTGAHADAADLIRGMLTPSAAPLLALRDPGAALRGLEEALAAQRRTDDARVARELRAVAGALDDAGHVALRARRIAHESPSTIPPMLDRATLLASVVPREGRHPLLDVAAALGGIESKLFPADLDALGVTSRDRVPPAARHALRGPFDRLVRLLGIAEVELAVSDQVGYTRVVAQPVPWVVAPASLLTQPEPLLIAALARPLTRIALGAPWLEDLPAEYAYVMLVAAARQASPDYASRALTPAQSSQVVDYERRVARAVGRKQKKALAALEGELDAAAGASLADLEAMARAVAQAELRVAYLATGDLLATLDELRALDGALAHATATGGVAALSAVLAHPLAGDVARFALTPEATALRRRVGTLG